MSPTRSGLTARAVAVVLAALSMAVLVLTYEYVVARPAGQRFDDAAMDTVYAGPDARLAVLGVLGGVSIGLVVVVMVVCVGLALARGHVRWAAGAVLVIVASNVSTQVLKRLILDRPDFGLGVLNSLPSGHTTVVASATVATVLVAPPALRPLLVLGGSAATTLTGASTIMAGWHRPADIVAALAVCLFWSGVASIFLSHRIVRVRGTGLASLAGSAAGIIVLGVLGVRPTTGWNGFPEAALVLGAIALIVSLFTVAAATLAFDDSVSRETSDSAVGVTGSPLTANGSRS